MKKASFYTLGCKLNYAETSTISRSMEAHGIQRVAFDQKPDLYVINTCSVTDNADKKCRKVINQAKKFAPEALIIIVGCYAQLKPQEISKIPGVDAVLGAAEKFNLPEHLNQITKGKSAQVFTSEIDQVSNFEHAYSYHDRTRSFLKVQDGCNYNCTFCTIPLARGKSRSDNIQAVVQNAQTLAKSGAKEIVLSGVNIGDYGIIKGKRVHKFIDLIEALDQVDGIERFRISSIEPNLLSNDIIDYVKYSNKFVPHFHIPLQSGSNEILSGMKRRYRKELYMERIDKIQQEMPDCAIGVDVIVGFPNESEKHFLETYEFINKLEVSYLHVFSYSERANTPAASMDIKTSDVEKSERSSMLRILSEKKKNKFYRRNLGKVHKVLFEQDVDQGMMNGFTDNYVRVTAPYDPLLINEIKTVKLVKISPKGLVEVTEPEYLSLESS